MKGVWADGGVTRETSAQAITALTRTKSELVKQAIHATLNLGAAIMFSVTRDGGALVITILDGDNRKKVYPTNVAEVTQALEDLVASFQTTKV